MRMRVVGSLVRDKCVVTKNCRYLTSRRRGAEVCVVEIDMRIQLRTNNILPILIASKHYQTKAMHVEVNAVHMALSF